MHVDYQNLRGHIRYGITQRSGAYYRLDSRRFKALVGAALLFLYGRISFLVFGTLDRIFFSGFRRVDVRNPLFVVGNFRSGTSLVYNMLSAAAPEVSAFKTWQIYLAPTISQRKIIRFFGLVDRTIARGRGARLVKRLNERHLRTVPVHPIDLFQPEEDAGLLMIAWTGFFTWFLFPRRGVDSQFVRFDELPGRYRLRIARFYRSLVQRHLYDASVCGFRPTPTFVSKNPTFTGMIQTLNEIFPDARFLYMMRGPDETYRSTMDWFGFWAWRVGDRRALVERERVRAMISHWYRYPPQVFRDMVQSRWAIVGLERLIAEPERMMILLGRRLELEWLVIERNRIAALAAMYRNYGSRFGVPRVISDEAGEPTITRANRSVSALVASESIDSVVRRFRAEFRLGNAMALRID